MSTALLLLLSGVLIGTGLALIWRDVYGSRRFGFALWSGSQASRAEKHNAELAVTPATQGAEEAPLTLNSRLQAVSDDGPLGPAERPAATAQQWAALQPMISSAVEQVNAVLAGAGVAIGTPGEPSWGASKAYGSDRRIQARGQSLAWLRLECMPGGRLKATVSAHDEALAGEINADASALASDADIARVSELLSKCLKPAASYAVRTKADLEQQSWKAVEAIVVSALTAGSGALSQAGAQLVPIAPVAWDADLRLHRMPVAVRVFGTDIARMHIDRIDSNEMEVAVGLPDARLANLGRRQRIPLDGMTMHALAEIIAACAWPAIAHYRETHSRL